MSHDLIVPVEVSSEPVAIKVITPVFEILPERGDEIFATVGTRANTRTTPQKTRAIKPSNAIDAKENFFPTKLLPNVMEVWPLDTQDIPYNIIK